MKTFKKQISIVAMLVFSIASSHYSLAQTETTNNEMNQCTQFVNVKVNGLVCDFCARALEKVFSKRDEVKSIDVNLDEGQVKVEFNENKNLEQSVLTQMITDSGYNVIEFLPGCTDG